MDHFITGAVRKTIVFNAGEKGVSVLSWKPFGTVLVGRIIICRCGDIVKDL